MSTITIASRFNGPPGTGNGGYSAGMIATAIGADVAVRLHQPVPLDRALTLAATEDGRWQVRAGDDVIASARIASAATSVPNAPSYADALAASKRYVGFKQHSLPSCFVCGPQRKHEDGLCIFPGAIEQAMTDGAPVLAAPWTPDATLGAGAGKIRPEFIWAALDCPGYFATAYPELALLGEFTVQIDRLVRIDEPCVVVAWSIGKDGRKHQAGTALFGEDGKQCAVGVATWIELKKQ